MTIQEILEAHTLITTGSIEDTSDTKRWRSECLGCEWMEPYSDERREHHRAHVADVLEAHMRGRCYEAWREGVAVFDPDAVDIMEAINPYAVKPC